MPRLLLFTACERVIVGNEDNSLSLIGVMPIISAQLPFPHDQPIPENTAMPFRWYFLALWKNTEEDIGNSFEELVILESPTGVEAIRTQQVLNMELAMMRSIHVMTLIPVIIGAFTAKIFLRPQSVNAEWRLYADFPLEVTRGPVIDLLPEHINRVAISPSDVAIDSESHD